MDRHDPQNIQQPDASCSRLRFSHDRKRTHNQASSSGCADRVHRTVHRKKAEAKEADLVGAIDYVLTFQELKDVFEAMDIDLMQMEESDKDHSSRAGRIYARTGGVSEAVAATSKRLNPKQPISIRTQQADGIPACRTMIKELIAGDVRANFYEGMGCIGGCVGGPKSVIDRIQGCENVNEYGDMASYPTPIDNPYVIEMLHRLGFDTTESLLEESEIFTRHF